MTQFNVFPMPFDMLYFYSSVLNYGNGCPTKEKDEPYGPRLNMGT